ncbi:phage tail protein (plasmid) [Moellerella wisconsensis]|uniref:phage tail protein n=1 Tax=Moellerella wisconsensis TaxID=158849 RepID=UPI001F4EF64B|nr:phage tail protein [Moellerella wisconsensis]UNH29290.1 phage tail protein [Moellerella wisconsensis]WJW83872.1 phage tail protein [Moellerella wisconsensis]
MERKTFKWHPKFESRKNFKTNVDKQVFDDGYEQRYSSGFNWRKLEWSLVFEGSYALIDEIDNFLFEHGGKNSFKWVSPDKKSYIIVCDEFNVVKNQGTKILTASFRQVFE